MRKIELKKDGVYLNGKPLYMRTILDQGFNPEGIYTYPTEEYLKNDIILAQNLGFNGARFHMRVFEERSLYWADKLGYIIWGEFPCGAALNDYGALAHTMPEWIESVERDYSHPCIIGWCPGNESYWRKDNIALYQETIYDMTKKIDPYRPCIDASGGIHFKTDMFDIHD
jgi:beta-galactosidase/beta-glucuronidase